MNCAEKPGSRHQGTVLIVDDEADDLQFAHRVVAATCPHLCVRSVSSGAEFICYVIGENGFGDRTDFPYPILVLLDLRMPDMHGFQVLSWLRDHAPHNLLPVVVLTASGEVQAAQYAYQLGARSFLTKPLRANEFKETMGKLQEWRKQAPALDDRVQKT